ncbi:MAG: GAF domain-containing protein [Oligoflexia bacterium]|nr:GAF domain-containing protein [Oligoflexia bacterium]
MSQELKIDFFQTTQHISPAIFSTLEKFSHKLLDPFSKVISEQKSSSSAVFVRKEITIENQIVAVLECEATNLDWLLNVIKLDLEKNIELAKISVERESELILKKDISYLSEISESSDNNLENCLREILRLAQSHVWVESASIFGIRDGYTLEGLMGVGGGKNQPEWTMDMSTIAGKTAAERKLYLSENPAKDPFFKTKENSVLPRNLLCIPLIFSDTLVGVINFSNSIGSHFTEEKITIAKKFADLTARILERIFLKQRMQSFEKTSGNLGKYLSNKVARSMSEKDSLALGGAEKRVVCLFSDIRNYTSISEDISPQDLVSLLNFYFERMHEVIEKYEGTLDKIVGDLVMAVWNIPYDQPDPELMAMKAALEMQKEMMKSVRPEWAKRGVEKVGIGIGVNAGQAIVGNLGSSRFMNYTVVGDTVNTAQRLESKARSGEIWMAESIFSFVNGKIEKPLRKEVDIRLKGKDQSINAFVYQPYSY